MKPKIKVGQWWETVGGQRVLIIGVTSEVKGVERQIAQPVVAMTIRGTCRWYSPDGSYFTSQATDEDLKTLLPTECDSFDWKPEPKWRDARPEDLTYPHKAVRFRDHDGDMWEHGKLVGIAYRGSNPVWIDEVKFHYWQCQVQESQ